MLDKKNIGIKQYGICPAIASVIKWKGRLSSIPILTISIDPAVIIPTTIKKVTNSNFHPYFGHCKSSSIVILVEIKTEKYVQDIKSKFV